MITDQWPYWLGLLIGLLLIGAGAVCAAHIPGVRTLTDAPPLDKEDR